MNNMRMYVHVCAGGRRCVCICRRMCTCVCVRVRVCSCLHLCVSASTCANLVWICVLALISVIFIFLFITLNFQRWLKNPFDWWKPFKPHWIHWKMHGLQAKNKWRFGDKCFCFGFFFFTWLLWNICICLLYIGKCVCLCVSACMYLHLCMCVYPWIHNAQC